MFLILSMIACLTTIEEAEHDYEWFHDSFNEIQAKVNQIHTHHEILRTALDPDEVSRLRMELAGMQQSCRVLVGRYNSTSDKVHRGFFMGTSLPDHLDTQLCEVK